MTAATDETHRRLASLVVDALLNADLLPKHQIHRAIEIAAEEILARQALGDYWCPQCPRRYPGPSSVTLSLPITCPYPRAYAFLSNPQTFPQWASGLGSALAPTPEEHTFIAQTPHGPMPVRFTPPNPFGVLDHYVQPPGLPEIHIPMRLLPNHDGCEITLTLFRQPTMTDEQFAADTDWVRRDLAALKAILESSHRGPG